VARHFLRLKWALLSNGLRRHPWGTFNAAGMLLLGVSLGGLVGIGLAQLGRSGGDLWLPAVFTAMFALWLIGPVIAFGVDETLDPSRLAPLPLRPHQLVTGLLAASTLSAGSGASALVLLGVLIGFASGAATVLVLGAVIVQLVLCLVAGRTLTTLISGALGSRRGRDLVTTLVLLLMLVFYGLGQLPNLLLNASEGPVPGTFRVDPGAALPILRYTPPGQAALVIVHARDGAYGHAVLALALAGLWVVLLLAAWAWSLGHLARRSSQRRSRARVRGRLVPAAMRAVLPSGRVAAVAARELRYIARHPSRRVRLAQNLVLIFLPLLPLLGGRVFDQEVVVLAAALPALVLLNEAAVQFGSDGAPLWAHVAVPGTWRSDIVGRNAALFVLLIPVTTVLALALAALTGGWRFVAFVPLLTVMTWGIGTALGNLIAAYVPIAVPEPEQGNLFGTSAWQGQGCLLGVMSMLALVVGVLLSVPAALGAWRFRDNAPALLLVCGAGAVWGVAVWLVGLAAATRRADSERLEILEAVTQR